MRGLSLTLRSGCCRDSRGRDTARYCRLSHKSVKSMREMLPCGPVPFLIKDGDTLKGANKLKEKWKLKWFSVQPTTISNSSSRLAKSRIGVHSRSVLPLTEKVQKVSPLTREILLPPLWSSGGNCRVAALFKMRRTWIARLRCGRSR